MHPQALAHDENALLALRLACDVLDQAERCGRPAILVQAQLGIACCYRALRELEAAEVHLNRALAWARVAQSPDAEVEVLCELCDVMVQLASALEDQDATAAHAAQERVRDRVFEVGQLAARVSDADWEVKVLLHISDVLNRLGDHDDASELQARAMRRMTGTSAATAEELPGLGRLADGK
jgi:tetratricopeptide (TPR) repeat protein